MQEAGGYPQTESGVGRGRGRVRDRSRTEGRETGGRNRSSSSSWRGEERDRSSTRASSRGRRGREELGIFQSVVPTGGVHSLVLQGRTESSSVQDVDERNKETISPKAMSVQEEGELTPERTHRSPHSPSYSPEQMQISPTSPTYERKLGWPIGRNVARRGELRGIGFFSRYWVEYKDPVQPCSKRFKDFDIFRLNQKFPMSVDESNRLAEYRKQTSKGSFVAAVSPAFKIPIQSRLQMKEDIWVEYRDISLPATQGILFSPPPDSISNAYRMRASPRIIDWKTKPGRTVVAMGGKGERMECPTWYCSEPDQKYRQELVALPDNIRIPIDDIIEPLSLFNLSPNVERECNIAFLGDSTIPGLIRPLEELIRAVEGYPGAPRYGHPKPLYGRGKVIYEIVNVDPVDNEGINFVVMKFQNDFLNVFGAKSTTMREKEDIVNRTLPELAREIDYILSKAHTTMMGASIIVIGMNPINSGATADFLHDDPHAVEFARRADYYLRTVVNRHCDVHFLSIVDIFQQNYPLLSPTTAVWGAHPTTVANFFIAKEIRKLIFLTYVARMKVGLADIPRFTLWEAQKGLLTPSQEVYCTEVLGLVASSEGKV